VGSAESGLEGLMSNDHHRENAYYLAHQQTLEELYGGQTVVIKDGCVVGAYDDAAWARLQTSNRYGGGAFFVQKVATLGLPGATPTGPLGLSNRSPRR